MRRVSPELYALAKDRLGHGYTASQVMEMTGLSNTVINRIARTGTYEAYRHLVSVDYERLTRLAHVEEAPTPAQPAPTFQPNNVQLAEVIRLLYKLSAQFDAAWGQPQPSQGETA